MEMSGSHMGDIVHPSSSATPEVATVTPEVETNASHQSARAESGSMASSSNSREKNWVKKDNNDVDGAFSATTQVSSKYLKGADCISIKAVKAHASKVGLGPASGFRRKQFQEKNDMQLKTTSLHFLT
ncbi:hypothetical protein COLO4_06787 [Corchorus olitorius]|uniref:Uncharacterized protein n=1 Tax=Corchorus olitorius TaxID=93759 RepID=A0A1R3KLZ2_9ROSI|nr:hypothetical protein COLO4_06787 [Corchorus olitorius]